MILFRKVVGTMAEFLLTDFDTPVVGNVQEEGQGSRAGEERTEANH